VPVVRLGDPADGTPAEIADGVAFLASDGGRYLHGAVLMVDGGVTA
jgi:NAD(P)-dependent dehydrogenase (short-subunit alcohol dehydrogenase family)